MERQTVNRRGKPSDIWGAVCEHRSSGQVGWSRHLTQAEGMPPRPGCELIGAGPMAGGYPGRIRTPMSSDPNDQRFVSQTVVQQPVTVSVQLGDPVALQCSITSQRTDHSIQCQGEPSVYRFRSGSGPSHPAAIYMNGNRSGEWQNSSGPLSAPQSCVYTLPKNNVESSDAGTYYCALAACGEVVFGSGTKIDITDPNHHLEIFVHRIMSSCCLLVILILILIIHYRSSGQVGWSRHLTQAEGMPPRPGCELIGAGPMAGGYPGRIRTPMSSVHCHNNISINCQPQKTRLWSNSLCQHQLSWETLWLSSALLPPRGRTTVTSAKGNPSCVYTLPKNNVDSSDAGTYYCALAACGEIVFGSGTKIDITDPNHHLEIFVHRIMSSCCLLVILILILIIHYRTAKQIV
ncbi:unnamed protein product [Gadus morhua 'NCC']